MIKSTKILSVILAVMMLISSMAVFAEENEVTVTFSDLDANTLVGKAVAELVPFGIINGYEDGTFRQDNTITRAEFSKIITTFLNMQNVGAEGLLSGFPDVDGATPHWGQKYIRLAVDRGIVKGYEDGTFRPDSPVKYSEAVKMTVCALGWGDVAASRTVAGSPWYAGYVAQAGELGLLSNLSINSQEDPASRGMVAVMISNALEADTAKTTTTVGGSSSTQSTGTSAREEFLKSTKITGVVVGCQQTSLDGESTKNNARLIAVDTGKEIKTYKVPTGTDTMAILGYKITANLNEDSTDDYEEIKAIQKMNTNKVFTVDGTLISSVEDNAINYWESETATREKNVGFERDMAVVYNGKYLEDYTNDDFNIKAGNIVFISNDGDASADVAFINNCEIFAVSSSGTDSETKLKKIYTLYGGGDIIVPESGKFVKVVNKGTEVEDTTSFSVSKYDIINLYRSKDNTVFDMTVTRNRISGNIDGVSTDEITIKGKDYRFAYNFAEYEGNDKPVFKTRNNANVYLDAEGRIAAAENVTTSADSSVFLGYLMYGETEEGIGGVSQIKMYGLSSGKTGERTYKLAKKVTVDGVQLSNTEAIDALLASSEIVNENKAKMGLKISDAPLAQLARFTLDKDGKIDFIDTPSPNVTVANDDMVQSLAFPNPADAKYDEDTVGQEGGWNGKYKYVSGNKFVEILSTSTGKTGKTVMGINSSTKVLVIPENMTDIKSYRNTSSSYFTVLADYRVEGYCLNDSKIAQYVIVYAGHDDAGIIADSPVALAETVVTAASDSDSTQIEDKLTGWNFKTGAELSELRAEEKNTLYGKIQTGEIFRYSLDDKYVNEVQMLFEIEDGKPVLFPGISVKNALAPVEDVDVAKSRRDIRFDSATRVPDSSQARFIYGTVVTKSEDEDGSNRVITLTNVVASDECEIDPDQADIFNFTSNTKFFVIDLTATRESDIITSDVGFDELRAFTELGESEDVANASQVFMHYSAGSIKTVAIIKTK